MSKVYKAQNIFYHNFMDFSIKNKPTRHYPTGLSAHPYSIYFSTEYSGRFWFFLNYPYRLVFTYISFAAKSALLHLPYIVRFTIFNLLFVPSTKPFESSQATEFSTASRSFYNPFANWDISFKSEFLCRSINKYNRGILFFSYTSRNSRTQRINSLSLGYFCKIYAS